MKEVVFSDGRVGVFCFVFFSVVRGFDWGNFT